MLAVSEAIRSHQAPDSSMRVRSTLTGVQSSCHKCWPRDLYENQGEMSEERLNNSRSSVVVVAHANWLALSAPCEAQLLELLCRLGLRLYGRFQGLGGVLGTDSEAPGLSRCLIRSRPSAWLCSMRCFAASSRRSTSATLVFKSLAACVSG